MSGFPHPIASKEGRKTYYIDAIFNFGHIDAISPCWRFQIAEGDDEIEVNIDCIIYLEDKEINYLEPRK
jgi:hypothetical protein